MNDTPITDDDDEGYGLLTIERRWHPDGFPGRMEIVQLGTCVLDRICAEVRKHAEANLFNVELDARAAVFEYAKLDGSERAIVFERVDGESFDDEHIDAIVGAAAAIGIPVEDTRAHDEADRFE